MLEWLNRPVLPPPSAWFRQRRKKPVGLFMYFVYILKSPGTNKYYVSSTEDLNKKLSYHNSGKVRSTKAYKPWEIIHFEKFDAKAEALRREKQIKSYK